LFLFQSHISDARQNFKEDKEDNGPNPLLVPISCISAKKANHLQESETITKSCLDEDGDTSSEKLLLEPVHHLQTQLHAERLSSSNLRHEIQCLTDIRYDKSAYLLAKALDFEDIKIRQLRSHQLIQLLLKQQG
jgi:hypothetical protein